VNVSAAGIHVYNRDGMTIATDPSSRGGRCRDLRGHIITRNTDMPLHIVPMGYRESGEDVVLAPFRPSTT
jgi:hypothetical protein